MMQYVKVQMPIVVALHVLQIRKLYVYQAKGAQYQGIYQVRQFAKYGNSSEV